MHKPEIIVEITLLPSAGGGRKGAIPKGKYPGVFGVGEDHFSIRFYVDNDEGFELGQTQHFGVQFLIPEIALKHFPVGAEFTVWEGKVIGKGRVLEVIPRD